MEQDIFYRRGAVEATAINGIYICLFAREGGGVRTLCTIHGTGPDERRDARAFADAYAGGLGPLATEAPNLLGLAARLLAYSLTDEWGEGSGRLTDDLRSLRESVDAAGGIVPDLDDDYADEVQR